jgi:8-oxo-dGTP pyrophosphatase MutT (NUDIX family)
MHKKVMVHIITKTGKLLLLKVIPRRGASWQPVTGSVDPGESWENAAKREVLEETGLDLDVIDLDLEFGFEDRLQRAVKERVYYAKLEQDADVAIDAIEHTDFIWLALDEIMPETMPYLAQYNAFLKIKERL